MADQNDLTPEERIRRADKQKREAVSRRSEVERIVRRLHRHMQENHFVENLYAQLDATRRSS